ncbi:hypothetical protein H6F46_06825 [Limnothrix sp. FACHB-1083]|uniref:hypothetical protein n=1 Tax=unclassified Limnothrix TaxID=2632864 RepID=UPI001680494F|nr:MULTISPECIES: hypothetical protein [unclassified Limnothrix]MBD2160406.1 hypothetical protein [Limnothrix sp. FACHB-1083]MBD2191107.1 hypothetical protein [Limnothrix sp. FACHB-1088]
MAKGFGSEPPVDPQPIRSTFATPSQHLRITFAEPSQDLATETTYSGVELANLLGWSESTLRNRFKTVLILVQRGVLTREELSENGRYTERARHLLESLGATLATDRMGGPRWLEEQAKTLKTFAAMAEAVPVEVVQDEPGYSGAIALYQQRTTAITQSTEEIVESTLTLVSGLRAQQLGFRRQRQEAMRQQARQHAAEDVAVYEATYAQTMNELAIASGNASVA